MVRHQNNNKNQSKELELVDRAALLNALLESSPVGIGFYDEKFRYIRMNGRSAKLNGHDATNHLGKTIREMILTKTSIVQPMLKSVLETGQPILNTQLSIKNPEKPHQEMNMLGNYFPVKSKSGKAVGIGAVVLDVTELTKATKALRESEEFRNQIFESSEDCYKVLDLDGNLLILTEVSMRHLEIEDLRPLIGKPWTLFFPRPEDIETAKKAVAEAASGGKGHFTAYYPTPSGKRKWWDIVITPMRNEHGKPERLLAISRDITPLRTAEEALKKANQDAALNLQKSYSTIKEMTDSLPVLFWWTDEGGKGNHYNKKWFEYTGVPVQHDPTQHGSFQRIIHPDDIENGIKIRAKALRERRSAKFEERVRRWDGVFRWHLVNATPIVDDNGNLVRWYASSTDIHEQKMLEQEEKRIAENLMSEKQELASKNTELYRFAAIAAHDLKSPLNSITQFTELLSDQFKGQLGDEADQYINFILNTGNRMRELIENLLEYARSGTIDKSKMEMISIQDVVGFVRKNLFVEIIKKDARISLSSNPPTVFANKSLVTQLFQNLIANAIKFHKPHHPPEIEINFSDQGTRWGFSVTDHGIGMDPKHSSKIFEIFNKLGQGASDGSGIGLAVCKRIVEAHGGKISFISEPDKGATFYFTLPKSP